jgi:hypothetical protein
MGAVVIYMCELYCEVSDILTNYIFKATFLSTSTRHNVLNTGGSILALNEEVVPGNDASNV